MSGLARFRVNVSDELCAALDKVCELTGASRSGVLAVVIRVHIGNLIRFLGNPPDTIDGGEEAVTAEEMGDSGEAQFLEASAKYAHELDLFVRAVGLTNTPDQ
jgi:hypothetical protein